MAEETNNQERNKMMIDESTLQVIQDNMKEFLHAGSVDAVYGKPIKQADTVIIPAAEVLSVMGFGIGSGYGRSPSSAEKDGDEENEGEGGGSGGGGGGRILSRPAAVVIATPDEVRVEPVMDFTKIGLAALTAGGFVLGMFFRMLSAKSALKEM
ncbi:MAG: spore germination protein GerW family protein [Anaerolineales bacterium]